jgi:hypothetical protein
MPIAFDCPFCHTPYRLKDELAGKRARCKNPACGQVLAIPQPNAPGPPTANGKAPSSAEVEAAAMAALADEAREEAAAAQAQAIPMTCAVCEHKWTEPPERAGKNVLCPECRHRQKVPVPKGSAPVDWRAGPQGPSLAKENVVQPTDVMGGEAKLVSGAALKQAGATNEELEPLSFKRKLMWAAVVVVPLLLVAGGAWFAYQTVRDRGHDRLMDQALAEFEAGRGELPPAEAAACAAVLHLAGGEYELAQDRDREVALTRAMAHFTKARAELTQAGQKDDPRRPTTQERWAAAAELAVAQLGLGGTDDQVNNAVRIRWVPEPINARALRANEKPKHVHDELSRTLPLLQGADSDLKAAVARRLTRELVKNGQAGLAADQLPTVLFGDADRAEGRAVIALEVYRLDKGSDRPRQAAEELRGQLDKGAAGGPMFQVLARVAGPDKGPPPAAGEAQGGDPARLVLVGQHLLDGRSGEALDLARKPGWSPPGRLRALILCGEWGPDGGAAGEAAAGLLAQEGRGKRETGLPPFALLRMAQLAALGGKPDPARALADAIPDEGLRAWAMGEVIRWGSIGGGTAEVGEEAAEAPDDPKKARAGHAWGRLWLARHNTRVGDTSAVRRAVDLWPAGTAKPFGLAGIALGLKDR